MSKGVIHLRSIYPSYRIDLKGSVDGKTKSVGSAHFVRNCATVDQAFEAQLRANPSYGSDFWIENPEAVQKGMSPAADDNAPDTTPGAIPDTTNTTTTTDTPGTDAGGESAPTGDTVVAGASEDAKAVKTPEPAKGKKGNAKP